jgi:drug/metabolite transporter (DMT)-like permease
LNRFPPTLISTHTFVNPLVALVLGWALAGEVLTPRLVFGGLVVIAAIAWMSRVSTGESQATNIHEPREAATARRRAA